MIKNLIALSVATLLVGCATYQPVPKDYSGPTASVRDTGFSVDGTKAQMFAVVEVDGNRIMNAFWASQIASHNKGVMLTPEYPERQVQARPMKVTLVGSHAVGMPIHEIASRLAGTFFSVRGIVDFAPKPNGRYVVKGDLQKNKSRVWIEDLETGQAVTPEVSN